MKLKCIQGDITTFEGDAIVNAANSSLMGGGGVDGAIHRWRSWNFGSLQTNCGTTRKMSAGHAVITTAGKIKAKFVIHTVGPIWRAEPITKRKLWHPVIKRAESRCSNDCKTIAFPISVRAFTGTQKQKPQKLQLRPCGIFSNTNRLLKVSLLFALMMKITNWPTLNWKIFNQDT